MINATEVVIVQFLNHIIDETTLNMVMGAFQFEIALNYYGYAFF